MIKYYFKHGFIAGALSALAGVIYLYLYQNLLFLDFSLVLNQWSIIGASFFASFLMAIGYYLVHCYGKPSFKGWLNILIVVLTFMSILGPITMTLPLDLDFPELFPGLAVPMHFFPAMIFFGLIPFFDKKT